MNYHRLYVGLLLQVIHFVANCLAENLILNINYKKPIAVTSDAFLSFTLDPATLLHNTDALTKNIERSTNMARGLVPAYIRLGGPQSNSYVFERAYLHDADYADVDSNDMLFEKQWTLIPEWAKNVGLDLIVSIAPRYIENGSEKDSKNSTNITELLSFTDFMGYNISWQLGYECQTTCNLSGGDLGQYVANFREILKTFPRYSNSLITGPDIVTYKTGHEQKYLQDYLNSADAALSAITWHPNFASVSLNNDSVSMHYDNMIADKNELYKIISRTARKKPLWIAESKPERFKYEYLGALIWTARLGNAAKLGVQVLMRQPSNFYKATPDYWVSLLHKTLVGRQVLELNVHSNNESYVHLYSQCTKPSALYDKGAITIFGINLTPKEITANLKGLKIETLHQYILSPDFKTGNNKMLSEKILLNNKPLDLINDKKLPNLNPEIIFKPDGLELKLSSGNIGFWVIPNAKVKACDYSEEEIAENIIEKRLWKRHKNVIQQNNQERKINDMKHYQRLMQESKRIKRDIGRKLIEIAPRMDNVLKKRSRFDNIKDNNMNERKMKRKDDFRRDELLTPFSPRITDSGENNFYGFFRRNPVKGFPESDIFITTGDSSEQNNKDYDYVQDENDENDSTVKNMHHIKELTQKHAEDNTWIEMENDHVPNEFFENVKFFNTRIKENPHSYGDLLEAEFFPHELLDKKKEKRAVEKDMQKLVNYYNFKEHDRDTKDKALDRALKRSSMPLSQFVEAPIYINHQASNIKPEKTKLKVESELKASSFFYLPSQIATVNSNYNNYNTKNTRHEETKVNEEKILTANISNSKNNINTEIIKFSRPAKIQTILAEEMIKENKENTKDCHCRIIRASQLSKKLCNCRVKRDNQIFADSSSEIESAESAQSEEYVENSMAKEEYENIIAGEILPSTSVIETDYEEHDITTETITTKSSTLDYRPSYETQTIDVNHSTSIMDNSEINNISEQYHNVEKSNIKKSMINSEFSPSNGEDSKNNAIVNITKEMFFRTKPPNVQSKNEATTYDPFQIVSKMFSDNKSNSQEFIASTTEYAQETSREKTQNLINKKKRTDSYSRITKNQKNEEGRDNNYKNSLKSTNFLETTQRIAEEQMTTETILSKQITAIDNSESNESKIKPDDNIKQNVEDNQNKDNQDIESEVETRLKKNIRTKKLKNIFRTAPLREHVRREEYLNRRTEQTNQLKEKLYARRKRLLQQYRQELTKIADEQKRNLKRRETWERFRENDDFRHLIDQGEFVGILIDNDKDNKNEIPVKLVPKQYENIPDQIYALAKVKEERYPKYNKYYQFPRHLKVIEDDEDSTFISSDRKYNQYYEPLPRIIKNEQQLAKASRFLDHDHFEKLIGDEQESKAASKSYDRRIFTIDPSTCLGDEPILQQLYENDSKLPKYYSEIKLKNQNPVPRWIYQVLSKSTLNEDQHQASKLQEYMKKTSFKNDQENANVIYIFDTQKQFDRQNGLELNNIYRNLEAEHDNLDMSITDKEMKLTKDVRLGKYIKNKKFIDSHEKEDILNVEKTEGTKNVEKFVNSKNIDMDKEEMLNIRKFKNITESEFKTEHLNDKRKNIAKNIYKIAKDTQKINNLNEKIKNDINTKMFNEAIKNVKKITDNNSELSKFGKGNARRRRDVKKQESDEYLKQMLHFLLTKTNTLDGSNHDTYDHLKENSKEIFSKQPIPLYSLTKNDKLELNTVPFQKLKNCLASSERDLEIDQQDKKEYKSPKYIVFISTKDKNSYQMVKVKDYDDLLEYIETPCSDENQYFPRKISDSIMEYLDDESSEGLIYEDLSDLLNERIENIPDKKMYSSESVQDVSIDTKDSGINDKSENENEQYKSEERYLEMKNQMRSDECGMFLLFPWKENEKKIRQRREIRNRINGGINQIEGEKR
ncbi:hypothetical protein ACFW04_001020 [Cataglyphis niger]